MWWAVSGLRGEGKGEIKVRMRLKRCKREEEVVRGLFKMTRLKGGSLRLLQRGARRLNERGGEDEQENEMGEEGW